MRNCFYSSYLVLTSTVLSYLWPIVYSIQYYQQNMRLSFVPFILSQASCKAASDSIGFRNMIGNNTMQCAEEDDNSPESQQIIEMIRDTHQTQNLTSIVYRIVQNDEVLAAGGIGESMIGSDVSATQNMFFRTGNVAYEMLGALVLLLVESGSITLEDTIDMYLDSEKLQLPNADSVTLEMLVRSTSGYPDYVDEQIFLDMITQNPFRSFEWTELVEIAFENGEPWCAPGTCFKYSHTNFILLGKALEVATGETLQQLLETRIIEPLGLAETATQLTPLVPSPVLHTYSAERSLATDSAMKLLDESTYWNPTWHSYPGGVVTSNVCDLIGYAKGLGSGVLFEDPNSYQIFLNNSTLPPPANCERCVDFAERNGYYGMGFAGSNSWIAATPIFGGAGQLVGYLPVAT